MIIVRVFDGLGNQLFHYAYARALQEKGFKVYLDTQKRYEDTFRKFKNHAKRENKLDYFKIKLPTSKDKHMAKYAFLKQISRREKLIYFLASHGLWFNKIWSAKKINEGIKEKGLQFGNYYLNGWFQNEELFKDIREQLLKELHPKKKIKISKELRKLLAEEELVSVHIRRGDYVRINNTLSLHYYRHAFQRVQEKYKQPKYLFFSDDINWVREQFGDMKYAYFISDYGQFEDYEELMIMSRCKSNIIANSTFSWWGAWLNKNPHKMVIAPKKWFDTQENIVPDEWVKM